MDIKLRIFKAVAHEKRIRLIQLLYAKERKLATFPLSRESGNEIRKSARDIMSSILSFWDSCRVSFSKIGET